MAQHDQSRSGESRQHHQRRRRRHLHAAGSLIFAMATINLSSASLLVSTPALPQSGRAAAAAAATATAAAAVSESRARSEHHGASSPTAVRTTAVAGGVRGGSVGSSREGNGDDNADIDDDKGKTKRHASPPVPSSKGGLAAAVQKMISKLLDVVENLTGKGGGSSLNAKKAKKSSKSSKKKAKAAGGSGFRESFEAKYGKIHPRFNEKAFEDATESAWSRNRLCLVYIAAGRGGGAKAAKADEAICKALADPKVAELVDSKFVMWVPGGKGSAQGTAAAAAAAAAAAKKVGARSLPFLGVVNSASITDKMSLERKLKRSTVALHHCNPPPSPAQMVSWMTRVLDLKKGLLETELAEQQRLKDESTIHTERVEGYSKSLKDDALREVREEEEEAERTRLEEEERRAQEAKEAKEREDVERREKKAADLGQEPPESALKGEGGGGAAAAATLMLRLADGSRVRRRFLRSDPMGKVLDWADVQGVDLEAQRLSSTFPKASFSHPADSALTIEEAGLGKQALLFVENKPKEAVVPVSGTGDEVEGPAVVPEASYAEDAQDDEL